MGVDLYEAAIHNLKLIHDICRDIDEKFFLFTSRCCPQINKDFLSNHENDDNYVILISYSVVNVE